MKFIKNIIKKCIPFYGGYSDSCQSGIHNQSYISYVIFRLTGSCGGGIQSTKRVLLPI